MSDGAVATVWEHLDDLRGTLIRMLTIIVLGMALALCFHQELMHFFTSPFEEINSSLGTAEIQRLRLVNHTHHPREYPLPKEATLWRSDLALSAITLGAGESVDIAVPINSQRLALISPLEGMAITLKTCFWVSLVATSPVWLLAALQFIYPALHAGEKRLLLPFALAFLFFLSMGLLFAYLVTIPAANHYLYNFNASLGLNFWSLEHYLDYTVILMLANGLAFELGFLLFFLVHYGFFSPKAMASKRRIAIVLAFVLGALLTPPDILTQFLLAVPLIGLYECAILYGRWKS